MGIALSYTRWRIALSERHPPPFPAEHRDDRPEREHGRGGEGHRPRVARADGEECLHVRKLAGDRHPALVREAGQEAAHRVGRELGDVGRDDAPRSLHEELHHERTDDRSEEHTSELQSLAYLVCRLLLEKKKNRHEGQASSPGYGHKYET